MNVEEKDILEFLRKNRFIGLTNLNPEVEELLVPYANSTDEVNYHFKTNFTEMQLRKTLQKYNISRRSPEELLNIRKAAKNR